jgi:murein DD-endopeptidase MepM/ murein hydrolase activator NlpD
MNNLLYVGKKVKVGAVSPIISVVEEEHVIEDKEVKYKTETSYDSTLAYGTVKVTQEGIDGLQRVTQKIQYENGYIVNAVVINTEELKPTVNKVIVKGTYSASGPIVIGDESEWAWPTEQPAFLSSFYQWRCLGGACSFHDGIDIYGPGKNSPIFASKSGNVYSSGWNVNGGGNQVVINHNNGYYTVYAHMNSIVRTMVPGQAVKQGQIIGYMGSTGYTTGVHLHFGIFTGAPPYYGGKSFNPMTLFR